MNTRRMWTVGVVVFWVTAPCWAVSTWTWAQVARNNNTEFNSDQDSDEGLNHAACSSYASWPSGTWSSAQASADRTVQGGVSLYTDVDGYIAVVGETTQASATATGYGRGGTDIIHGPGETVTGGVLIGPVELVVKDALATTTVALDFEADGIPLASGSATLAGNGALSGSGVYAQSFFDVFFDVGTGWHAVYKGPSTVPVVLPVESFFDVFVEIRVEGSPHSDDSEAVQEVSFTLPEGYTLIPEPVTLAVLALGGLLGIRRK